MTDAGIGGRRGVGPRARHDLRIEIVGGGRPDAETFAAIGLAIDATIGARLAEHGTGAGDGAEPPAWRRAALREGVGGAVEVEPERRGRA